VSTFAAIQDASYTHAGDALRGSWPHDKAMSAEALASFLDDRRYCVLATTTTRGHAQARPVGFAVFDGSFWFATVEGGRLQNVRRTPWVSVVVTEGEGKAHRAVAADGPVTVVDRPPADVLAAWEARFGSRAEWASAWFELRPKRLFSYTA
jgi:nitroimidazol reductase NimA-like FMN-containing flavoprotein (pyridoxamine 5'-phosphate oxidase superfamily)